MTTEDLINSCIRQLDSRLPLYNVNSEKEKGLNRIYLDEDKTRTYRGHAFRLFETPLVRVYKTISQITSQLENSPNPVPQNLNKKLIAIYEQAEIEENKTLNSSLADRITQSFWTVISAPWRHTLRPDWAVVSDAKQKEILSGFQKTISLHFLKNQIQVDRAYNELFSSLLKDDLTYIDLICSVPSEERVSVFEAFKAFKGKPIFGLENFIVKNLEAIAPENRKSAAFHIASFWIAGKKPIFSFPNPISNLFMMAAKLSPDRQNLFCKTLSFFINKNIQEFTDPQEKDKIDYYKVDKLIEEVFFTEEMGSEDLQKVFEKIFAISPDKRTHLGKLGDALKRAGFNLDDVLKRLEDLPKDETREGAIKKLLKSLQENSEKSQSAPKPPKNSNAIQKKLAKTIQELEDIFGEKISSKQVLKQLWKLWIVTNHPDKIGNSTEAHTKFTKVSNLKSQCEKLFDNPSL